MSVALVIARVQRPRLELGQQLALGRGAVDRHRAQRALADRLGAQPLDLQLDARGVLLAGGQLGHRPTGVGILAAQRAQGRAGLGGAGAGLGELAVQLGQLERELVADLLLAIERGAIDQPGREIVAGAGHQLGLARAELHQQAALPAQQVGGGVEAGRGAGRWPRSASGGSSSRDRAACRAATTAALIAVSSPSIRVTSASRRASSASWRWRCMRSAATPSLSGDRCSGAIHESVATKYTSRPQPAEPADGRDQQRQREQPAAPRRRQRGVGGGGRDRRDLVGDRRAGWLDERRRRRERHRRERRARPGQLERGRPRRPR
jgi:hypothetical protein